jgi:hypothetical protein
MIYRCHPHTGPSIWEFLIVLAALLAVGSLLGWLTGRKMFG